MEMLNRRSDKRVPDGEDASELSGPRARPAFVFCAGGGAIGTAAAGTARSLGMSVAVMDIDPDCLASRSDDVEVITLSEVDPERIGSIQFVVGDSVGGLLRLCETRVPDLIVPAMSGHFAARVAVEFLARRGARAVPCTSLLDRTARRLPPGKILSRDEANAVLVVSNMPAGGTCEPSCSQPRKCPVTGEIHKAPMHELIGSIISEEADRSTVLAVGTLGEIGVIQGPDLHNMLGRLEPLGDGPTFALATACKCHGIVNFLATGRVERDGV